MPTKTTFKLHAFHRDDALQAYCLAIGNRPALQLPAHLVTPKTAVALGELVQAANVDRKTLCTLSDYTERLDAMLDAYHLAPLWRRMWWALSNSLPYVKPPEADPTTPR